MVHPCLDHVSWIVCPETCAGLRASSWILLCLWAFEQLSCDVCLTKKLLFSSVVISFKNTDVKNYVDIFLIKYIRSIHWDSSVLVGHKKHTSGPNFSPVETSVYIDQWLALVVVGGASFAILTIRLFPIQIFTSDTSCEFYSVWLYPCKQITTEIVVSIHTPFPLTYNGPVLSASIRVKSENTRDVFELTPGGNALWLTLWWETKISC